MRKSILPFLGLYAMSMMESAREHQEFMEDINRPIVRKKVNVNREVKKVIPKGCKEYHFIKSGMEVSETCTYIHFSCIASNIKVALRKLEKFDSEKLK